MKLSDIQPSNHPETLLTVNQCFCFCFFQILVFQQWFGRVKKRGDFAQGNFEARAIFHLKKMHDESKIYF